MTVDPWVWLLGRTPANAWRHVPYQAVAPGPGQDPGQEPRVEVIRRLIAYPEPVFRAVVEAVAAVDRPERPVRWLCYRAPGDEPTRPYWLCFVSVEPSGGRRFHFGLELFDRARLALWFFSGYDPAAVPPELRTAFPTRAGLYLPRVALGLDDLARVPVAAWIHAAWSDALTFSNNGAATPVGTSSQGSADESRVLDASLLALPSDAYHQLGLRFSRARLAVCPADGPVTLHPICRLTTVVGRDPRSHLVIDERSVSMEQVRIVWRHGVPEVEDLGSKNGTTVAGIRIAPHIPRRLGTEARIELGSLTCLFFADPRPGLEGPAQEPRLAALVGRGVLTQEQVDDATREAGERGITPAEVLLARRRLTAEQWSPTPSYGSCGAAAGALLALAGAAWLLA